MVAAFQNFKSQRKEDSKSQASLHYAVDPVSKAAVSVDRIIYLNLKWLVDLSYGYECFV